MVVSNTDNAHAVNIAYMPLRDQVKNSDSSTVHPGEPEVRHLQWLPRTRLVPQKAQLCVFLQLFIVSLGKEVALTSHPALPSKGWSSEGFPTKSNLFLNPGSAS